MSSGKPPEQRTRRSPFVDPDCSARRCCRGAGVSGSSACSPCCCRGWCRTEPGEARDRVGNGRSDGGGGHGRGEPKTLHAGPRRGRSVLESRFRLVRRSGGLTAILLDGGVGQWVMPAPMGAHGPGVCLVAPRGPSGSIGSGHGLELMAVEDAAAHPEPLLCPRSVATRATPGRPPTPMDSLETRSTGQGMGAEPVSGRMAVRYETAPQPQLGLQTTLHAACCRRLGMRIPLRPRMPKGGGERASARCSQCG